MKFIIANAFSLNMIPSGMFGEERPGSGIAAQAAEMSVRPVALEDVKKNWANVLLGTDTILYVARYQGPRLPEGTIKAKF